MLVLHATDLTRRELRGLSADLIQRLAKERWVLSRWRGNRPPEGYVLTLPCRLASPVLRAAVRHVLEQVGSTHFDDAMRLEERVLGVAPFGPEVDELVGAVCPEPGHLGMWRPCLPDDPTCCGYICLSEDAGMGLDRGRLVFAHECGHAVCRTQAWGGPEDIDVPDHPDIDWLAEARANQYVIEWGFLEQLLKARSDGLLLVTFADIERVRHLQGETGLRRTSRGKIMTASPLEPQGR